MMSRDCLRHSLTDAERDVFERDGFFFVPNALTADQVAHYVSAVDDADAAFRAKNELRPEERVNMHDAIGADPRFLDLIDWPTTFPKVWGLPRLEHPALPHPARRVAAAPAVCEGQAVGLAPGQQPDEPGHGGGSAAPRVSQGAVLPE
jgi:hypothetical protein